MSTILGFLFAVFAVLFAMFLFLIIIPTWKMFSKAGQAGWKSLIPIYNAYIMVEIAKLPWWVFLGFFIPVLNLVVLIVVMYHLSMRFGHGMGYGLGLTFLPFVFLPILGYGSSQYDMSETAASDAVPNESGHATEPVQTQPQPQAQAERPHDTSTAQPVQNTDTSSSN